MSVKTILTAIAISAYLLFSSMSFANELGTAEEAKSMLERAVLAMNEDTDTAIKAFNEGTDGFKDRDLYVACFMQGTSDTIMTAHGAIAALIGTSSNELTDKKGTKLVNLLDHDTQGEIRTATYWWPRPGSTEAVEKQSFFATVAGQNCLVGYYK